MTDIESWLAAHGLDKYAEVFVEHEIEIDDLGDLTDQDLRELGLPMGPRKRLLRVVTTANSPGDERLVSVDAPAREPQPAASGSEAERRQLTVMFADLVDSTALSRQLELEDVREVNRAYQQSVTAEIERFEGSVARYMGDGVMAYFGYPLAHEDDAERAVRAGLALIERVKALDVERLVGSDVQLACRVGIATGPVVVGDLIGEGAAQEWAVVGETPNLAARVESSAAPDAVAVSPATYRLTKPFFDYKSMGERRLKGIDGPVELWQAVDQLSVSSRFRIAKASDLTPLIGRDDELALLRRRWQAATEGEGNAVMLCGEPGIGKSRLAEALRECVQDTPHTWLSFQCSPHHINSPYHPFVTHLGHAAGLTRASDDDQRVARLKQTLEQSHGAREEDFQALGALLGIGPAREAHIGTLAPQQRKEGMHQALIRQVLGTDGGSPTLCLFEDLHWSDASTLEVLDQVVAELESSKALVILTFRPDFQVPWHGHACTTLLTLGRLSIRGSKQIIEFVSRQRGLTEQLTEQIAIRADGVPLFIEELTQWTAELPRRSSLLNARREPRAQSDVPETLRDALMARLDQSSAVARDIAQTASVIGREFDYRLLERVSDAAPNDVRTCVEQLEAVGLVNVRGTPPEATCRFKHALVRDATYESILRNSVARLHGRVADALIAGGSVISASDSALIAFHLELANRSGDASRHWLLAGRQAAAAFANHETLSNLDRFLSVVESSTQIASAHDQVEASNLYLQATTDLYGFSSIQVHDAFKRVAPLVREHADPEGLFDFLRHNSRRDVSRRREEDAIRSSNEMATIAAEHLDSTRLSIAHYARARDLYYMGRFPECLEAAQTAEKLGGPFLPVDDVGQGAAADCVAGAGFQCRAMWIMGLKEQAFARGNALLDETLAKKFQPGAVAWAMVTLVRLCFYESLPDDTKRHATALLDVAEAHGMTHRIRDGLVFLGWADVVLGDEAGGLAKMLAATRDPEHATQHSAEVRAMVADAMLRAGDIDSAQCWATTALEMAGQPERYHAAPWMLATAAEVGIAHSGQMPVDLGLFETALVLAEKRKALSWGLRCALRMWIVEHRYEVNDSRAKTWLQRLYPQFTEGFAYTDLREAKKILQDPE